MTRSKSDLFVLNLWLIMCFLLFLTTHIHAILYRTIPYQYKHLIKHPRKLGEKERGKKLLHQQKRYSCSLSLDQWICCTNKFISVLSSQPLSRCTSTKAKIFLYPAKIKNNSRLYQPKSKSFTLYQYNSRQKQFSLITKMMMNQATRGASKCALIEQKDLKLKEILSLAHEIRFHK